MSKLYISAKSKGRVQMSQAQDERAKNFLLHHEHSSAWKEEMQRLLYGMEDAFLPSDRSQTPGAGVASGPGETAGFWTGQAGCRPQCRSRAYIPHQKKETEAPVARVEER